MDVKKLQLPLQTLSLVLGFMVWVILSSLMPFIIDDIHLTSLQVTWVTAIPILTGSIMRIPVGYWTNRHGARKLLYISFLLLLAPIYWVSLASTFTDLIIGGFFPLLILTLLYNITGHYAIGFMALSEVALASLIMVVWMETNPNGTK